MASALGERDDVDRGEAVRLYDYAARVHALPPPEVEEAAAELVAAEPADVARASAEACRGHGEVRGVAAPAAFELLHDAEASWRCGAELDHGLSDAQDVWGLHGGLVYGRSADKF